MFVTFDEIPVNGIFASRANTAFIYRKIDYQHYRAIYRRCNGGKSERFVKLTKGMDLPIYHSDGRYFKLVDTINEGRVIIKI